MCAGVRVHPWQVGDVGRGRRPQRAQAWWVCVWERDRAHTWVIVYAHSLAAWGGAYTCWAGGLAPLRPQAASPRLPRLSLFLPGLTSPKIKLISGGFMVLCPLNWEPRLLCEPRVSHLRSGCLIEGLDADDHRALCFSAQTGPEVGGACPRAQSPAQVGARGPHRPHPPRVSGLHPRREEERAQPASPGDNGFQPPACPPSTRRPGGRLQRCGTTRGTSRLL